MTSFPRITDAPRGSRVSWVYGGVWGVLAHCFLVPEEPPELPSVDGEATKSFRPAPAFLRYLLLKVGVVLGVKLLALVAIGVTLSVAEPAVGLPILAVGLIVLSFVAAVAVLAIHLRYDTTWYVLSDRSLRIRRGIWVIRETTITFENIQNVTVNQGPLQRLFGIADVQVDTAGGGGAAAGHQHGAAGLGHHGLIEGVAEAHAIRDLLTAKMSASRTAGLGDEARHVEQRGSAAGWTAEHLAALRAIREAALALS